jgi:hypothetical protein
VDGIPRILGRTVGGDVERTGLLLIEGRGDLPDSGLRSGDGEGRSLAPEL